MKLYRLSPIQNKEELFEALKHIHFADIDVLAYVSTETMVAAVQVKLSEETKL